MTCSEFLARFTEFYDAPEGTPDRVAGVRHLADCASCRRYVEVVDRGVSMLRTVPRVNLASNFGARLEHRLLHAMEDDSRQRNGSSSAIPVATVVGMAVLLTAVAWAPRFGSSTPEVELPPIVVAEPPDEPAPYGTVPPYFGGGPTPLEMRLFDDPSLFSQYSPLNSKYRSGRSNGPLRRTGLD